MLVLPTVTGILGQRSQRLAKSPREVIPEESVIIGNPRSGIIREKPMQQERPLTFRLAPG